MWKALLPALATSFLILGTPPAPRAEVYKWVDKNGVTHFTDDPDQLPEPMRSRALEKLRQEQEKEKKKRDSSRRRDDLPNETLPPPPGKTNTTGSGPQDTLSNTTTPPPSPSPPPARSPGAGSARARDKARKKWETRVEKARQRVEGLETRCKDLETKKDRSGRNALIYARPGDRKQANQSRKALEECRKQLDKARHHLNVELPEEARRAGVPPGWLR